MALARAKPERVAVRVSGSRHHQPCGSGADGVDDRLARRCLRGKRPISHRHRRGRLDGLLRKLINGHRAAPLLDGITILKTDGLAASRDVDRTVSHLRQALNTLDARGVPRCIPGGAGFAGMRTMLTCSSVLTDGIEAGAHQLLTPR
ncbi:hypothetical protein [Xylophilus sp. GOD-11R]|uniref:hypothetical protein n=1 Tax=Xylophilus sp. GOD-11R TaxID=3089814 RepID=UPI00298C0C7F|nr:hypothetical protein [Xylophilus sp. GOD-11R]WPB54979.1 hypothetical protein R9X41_12425 [Xylophilus sp. GOD-11R]